MYDIATILLIGFALFSVYRGCKEDVQNARARVLDTQAKKEQSGDVDASPRPSAATESEPSDDPPPYSDVVARERASKWIEGGTGDE